MRRLFPLFCSISSRSSFVLETLQRHPELSFIDVLYQWHCRYLTAVPYDACDAWNREVKDGANDVTRVYDTAEIQLLNRFYERPMSAQMNRFLQHYSLAHFAAEVGSNLLLDLFSSQGVMLHAGSYGDVQEPHASVHRLRVPLMRVVFSLPDAEGYYISHLAAKHGHLDFLRNMVERFGAESILNQRLARNDRRCRDASMNVYEIAFVYGHIPVLKWVDAFHPAFGFRSVEDNALRCIQLAAVHGQVEPLEYFLHRCGSNVHNIFREAFYPAAESGAEDVLNFVVDAIGEEVIWLPNDAGATALHHAARLGRVELLLGFFQRYNIEQHVDETDNCGRNPAMWCVIGGKRAQNIEFLRLLLHFGSRWPLSTDNEGRDMRTFAQLHYSPAARITKFITECFASARLKE